MAHTCTMTFYVYELSYSAKPRFCLQNTVVSYDEHLPKRVVSAP